MLQIGSKSDWKSLIETKGVRDKSETDSGWIEKVSELVSNPDYMSPEEIVAEREELKRRSEKLEERMRISSEIEEQINQVAML